MTYSDIEFLNSISHSALYNKDQYSNAPFTFNDYQDKKYIVLRSKQTKDSKELENSNSIEFVMEDEKVDNEYMDDYYVLKIDPLKLKLAFFSNFIRQYYEQAI